MQVIHRLVLMIHRCKTQVTPTQYSYKFAQTDKKTENNDDNIRKIMYNIMYYRATDS